LPKSRDDNGKTPMNYRRTGGNPTSWPPSRTASSGSAA
jgi:hypothetical protein